MIDVRQGWRRANLSPDQRKTIHLRYGLDFTQEEAAEHLGAPRTTIAYRIERGGGPDRRSPERHELRRQ
ncbi:sigma factor-like helix-turn-helix DNA-binding protein [Streptomyces sp. NPDC056672]|uniref:sigma-70 region 4 domain-containing protein n=1 Tax=Streptomyces sp. NPDC056672 TaxID=3345906 RepID=UPI0036CC20B7